MFGRKNKASQAQIEANRLNSQKSTGPKTEEGKNRSKCNGFRHGLSAQVAVMTDPEREAQQKFITEYLADLAPSGAQETQLAQAIAFDSWRTNKVRAIEENTFFLGLTDTAGNVICEHPEIHSALSNARTFFFEPEKFVLLSLYEQRIHRNFHRNMKLFRELRKERESRLTTPPPAEAAKPLTMGASASGSTAATPEPAHTTARNATQPPASSAISNEIGFAHSKTNKAPMSVQQNLAVATAETPDTSRHSPMPHETTAAQPLR